MYAAKNIDQRANNKKNPTKNLIEPKLLKNPIKILIELKHYMNPH